MATLEEYEYDDMTSIDIIEDVENKLEDLIEEKIEILGNIFQLRMFYNQIIDEESFEHIQSFMVEVMQEATNEQIILNKLYDYLMVQLDKYGYDKLENSRLFLEYVNLLSYFDDIEDTRAEEYFSYLEKIGQLMRVNAISPSYLEEHRKYTQLDTDKTNAIYVKVPSIKK